MTMPVNNFLATTDPAKREIKDYSWEELCNDPIAIQMPLVPPFTENTAKAKVRRAQDLWNTKDPEKVALAYTEDTEWRNRNEFFIGRQAITAFLTRKWQKELDYRLKKEIFLFSVDKIAVQFEYEWHDAQGQWFRSYGLEHWEFAIDGLMKKRVSSINDLPIQTRTAPAKQVSLAATDPVKAI